MRTPSPLRWLFAPLLAIVLGAQAPMPPAVTAIVDAASDAEARAALVRLERSRALEQTRLFFEAFRLPRPLILRARNCDGRAGAWYNQDAVNVCFGYLQAAIANATRPDRPSWLAEEPSIRGQFLDVFIHEGAHAVFEQLRTPLFGKEEDAADSFATYAILNLFPAEAEGLINGIIHSYLVDADLNDFGQIGSLRPLWPPNRQYGGAHSLPLQRVYNVVCLASGFDQARFGELRQRSDLPGWRANGCEDEYRQVANAFRALIGPHVDRGRLDQAFPGHSLFAER